MGKLNRDLVIQYWRPRQRDRCFYCNRPLDETLNIEHLLAKSLGGRDNIENLRLTHAKCNSVVGAFSVSTKLRLHHVARTEGSSAFWTLVNSLYAESNRQKKRKKIMVVEAVHSDSEEIKEAAFQARVSRSEKRINQSLSEKPRGERSLYVEKFRRSGGVAAYTGQAPAAEVSVSPSEPSESKS